MNCEIDEGDFSCIELAEICETTPRQIGAAFKNGEFVHHLFERGFLADVAKDSEWGDERKHTYIAITRAA
jgi:hypothetical protein